MSKALKVFSNLFRQLRRNPIAPRRIFHEEWRLLAEGFPVVLYEALADRQGTKLFVAGSLERMLGYAPSEWMRHPDTWYKNLHPEDRPRVMRELAHLPPERPVEITYRIRHKAGAWRWVRDSVVLFEKPSGRRYLLGAMIDATRERELEQATVEHNIFLEDLLRTGPWVIYRLEGPEQRVAYVSPNVETLLGFPAVELIGQNPEKLIERVHPDDRSLFRRHFSLLRQAGGDQTRLRFRVGSREYHWLVLHGRKASEHEEVYLGYLMDVEEKVRHKHKMSMDTARQQALYDLGRIAWSVTRPERFYDKVIEVLDRILHPDYIAVLKFEDEPRGLRVVRSKSMPVGTVIGLNNTQAGYALRMNGPVVSHDLENERRFPLSKRLTEHGIKSALGVPIPGEGVPFGILGVGFKRTFEIDGSAVQFAQQVAQFMGQVLRYRKVVDDLEHKAYHDDLTDLPNRRALYRHLSSVLSDPQASGAVAFIDLIDFGGINDTWGHETGDRLLRQLAARLLHSEDDLAWAARWGGDEFVLVMRGSQPSDLLQQLLDRIGEPTQLQGQEVQLSARAGMVRFPEFGSTAETLLRRADMALALAKQRRSSIYEYEEGLHERVAARRARVEALRRAIERGDELFLHLQPVISADGKEVVAAEALLRWRDPRTGELIPPGEFVPLAERYGFASQLDAAALRIGVQIGLRWLERWGKRAPRLTVNVSPGSILDPAFTRNLEEILQASGYPPEWLGIEITERVIADVEHTHNPLARLRELGVRIALDDFGTGYSSLAYLAYLNVDILKVDRAFTRDIGRNSRTEAVIRSIFALGSDLGMNTTAEGVEEASQLDWLRKNGCEWVQGFALARPMPPEAFERWFDERAAQPQ